MGCLEIASGQQSASRGHVVIIGRTAEYNLNVAVKHRPLVWNQSGCGVSVAASELSAEM